MRELTLEDLDDMVLGATLLGAGSSSLAAAMSLSNSLSNTSRLKSFMRIGYSTPSR